MDKQLSAGIDIVNDGEMPRTDFVSYITDRMTGFGRGPGPTRPVPMDAKTFPIWFDQINQSGRRRINVYDFPQAIGDVAYGDLSGVKAECAGFKAALAKRDDSVSRNLHDGGLAGLRRDRDHQPALRFRRGLRLRAGAGA